MATAILYFFSGTGNTWWVGKTLAEELKSLGVNTRLWSIEKGPPNVEDIVNSDYVGFGYPVYGSDCPPNMIEYLENLPDMDEKNCFIFTSMLAFSGDGALTTKKTLEEKGYKLDHAVNFLMFNNIKLPYPVMADLPTHTESQAVLRREKTRNKIQIMARRIVDGERWIEGRGILGRIGGLSQRIPMSYLGWTRWSKNFLLDKDACTGCQQCVDNCPSQNISYNNGEIEWHDRCICCIRCYNLCPTDAILYKEASRDRDKYKRFKGPVPGFKVTDIQSGN